jgi:hypothetical protein
MSYKWIWIVRRGECQDLFCIVLQKTFPKKFLVNSFFVKIYFALSYKWGKQKNRESFDSLFFLMTTC